MRPKWMLKIQVIASLIVALAAADAQTPVPSTSKKNSPVTVRDFLEGKFETFLYGCIGEKTLHTKGWFFGVPQHQIPAIPDQIISNNSQFLGEQIPSPPVVGNDIGAAFTYVISDSDKKAGVVDMTDKKRHLDPDRDLADAPSSLAAHFSGVAYSNSCGEIVNATVQGNAGASFPFGNVKAMLSSQYNLRQNSEIVVAMGPMDSPLQFSTNAIPDPARLYRDLLVWGWYQKNPSEIGKTNWVYDRLIGVAYYKRLDSSSSAKLNGSVDMKVTAPFLSLSGSVSSQITNSSNLQIMDAQTLPFTPVKDSEFVPLPDADSVISEVNNIKLAPYSPPQPQSGQGRDTAVLVSGQSYDFYQKISGLSASWCGTGQWPSVNQTSPASTLAKVQIVDAALDPQNKSLCVFHLQLVPQGAIDPASNPSLDVNFAIQNTIHASPDKTIALNASEFKINVSKSPVFVKQFSNSIPAPGGVPGSSNISLQWTDSIAIDDSDNPIVSVVNAPTAFGLTCGSSTTPLPGVDVKVDWQPTPNKLLTVTTTYQTSDPNQLDIKNGKPIVGCTLSVNLVFNMTTGNPITKTQTFAMNTYPPVPPAPPPAPALQPAPTPQSTSSAPKPQ